MNNKILSFIFILSLNCLPAQKKINNSAYHKQSADKMYQLFPTKNFWTFIKLNTRNGKMWQVHFAVKEGDNRVILNLNSISLVAEEKEVNGRFTLYPTENTYNFLLLDQIEGTAYQVQWSMEENNRGILPIQ
ncbi:hypothetical protein [Chryseobacterium mucoviscidosis]|uniref:Uncharacterized protein n=1 Tax=Chryseobacterium mucoviscidosis TaxID=1945581 RepID=A0A202CDD3_9FLAO|nr:hypothetical protein [Chryseobacterium mucoviscidosis]OVE61796.1 hypothetical protein B0E34_02110 [Chryseobacterium mucoviscidosis]